jgi:hypothetical protein
MAPLLEVLGSKILGKTAARERDCEVARPETTGAAERANQPRRPQRNTIEGMAA